MSEVGQSRHFGRWPTTSGLPQSTDIIRPARLVRFVPKAEALDGQLYFRLASWAVFTVRNGLDHPI
jgi:hypothetical protein